MQKFPKKTEKIRARFTQSHAGSLEATLKVKIIPEIYYQRLRVPQFKKSPEGESAKAKRRGERKTTEMMQKLNKRGEEILWKSGQLGRGNPRVLINTMWWLLTQHFGLSGRQQHHNMKVEDFSLQREDDGIEYLTFAEGPTKTRQGGLSVKP